VITILPNHVGSPCVPVWVNCPICKWVGREGERSRVRGWRHRHPSHCSPKQLEDGIRNQIKDDNTVTDRICGQDMHFDGPASLCPSPDALFPVVEVDDGKRYIHHEINLNLMARSINLAKHVNPMSSCLLQLRCLGSLNGFLPLQEDVKSASTLYSIHNSPVSQSMSSLNLCVNKVQMILKIPNAR
jgi:hypothetical protein